MPNALLPYIAAGFAITPTPGNGNQCGFYALAASLQAARELARSPNEVIVPEYTYRDIRGWITNNDPDWLEYVPIS